MLSVIQMIFINEQMLNNKEELSNLINAEKQNITNNIKIQKNIKNMLLMYVEKISEYLDKISVEKADFLLKIFEDLKTSLNNCNDNIFYLKKQKKYLDNKNIYTGQFNDKYIQLSKDISENTANIESFLYYILLYCEINFPIETNNNESEIAETNKKQTEISETDKKQPEISKTNKKQTEISETDKKQPETSKANKKQTEISETNKNTTENLNTETNNTRLNTDNASELQYNTLLISELHGKVVLPYTDASLQEILQNNPDKYSNIQEIIYEEFTLPLSRFKNSAIARFREAYKLIKNKEKGTIKDAFELGMELLFNYNLHPAIITACKNVDELDIYLDYLENNELGKFDCFKIIFEIPPTTVKK